MGDFGRSQLCPLRSLSCWRWTCRLGPSPLSPQQRVKRDAPACLAEAGRLSTWLGLGLGLGLASPSP